MTGHPLSRRLLAEFLGAGLLVTVVVGSGIAAQQLSPSQPGLELLRKSTAAVFGLAVLRRQHRRQRGHPPRRQDGARTPLREHELPTEHDKPSVLFVCVHNAGRSQMAAGWLTHLAGNRVEVRSAGTAPSHQVNPAAVAVMAEVGIDISDQTPKQLVPDTVQASDIVITMGCGDTCPYYRGKRYLDWELEDPAGLDIDAVRPIRDEIKARVQRLLTELLQATTT